jgi:hypothetical protein
VIAYIALYICSSQLQPPEVKNLRRMKTLEGVSGLPHARKGKAAGERSTAGCTLTVAAGASGDLPASDINHHNLLCHQDLRLGDGGRSCPLYAVPMRSICNWLESCKFLAAGVERLMIITGVRSFSVGLACRVCNKSKVRTS